MAFSLFIDGKDYTALAKNLSHSNVDPGGYETLSFDLDNRKSLPTPGATVRAYEGMTPVFSGRVEEPGQNYKGVQTAGRVACVGDGAALRDVPFPMIYVDRDMNRWSQPSYGRKSSYTTYFPGSIAPDDATGLPSLVLEMSGPWRASAGSAMFYYMPDGAAIGDLYFSYTWTGGTADANWNLRCRSLSDDSAAPSATVLASNLDGAASGSGTYYSATAGHTIFELEQWYAIAETPVSGPYYARFQNVAVYGGHGLTKRGSTDPKGYYASDIVDYVRRQVSGLEAGTIQNSGYVVPHAVYPDPEYPEVQIDDMAKIEGYHWGVWTWGLDTTPRLDFRPPASTATVLAARNDCEDLDLTERLSDMHNSVKVVWSDAGGAHGITTVNRNNARMPIGLSRTATVQMPFPGNATDATTYGTMLLALEEQQSRAAGYAVIRGSIKTMNGQTRSVNTLRAGIDRIKIIDLPNSGPWTETDTRRFDNFRIARVECSYDKGGSPVARLELDAGANLLEVLNARFDRAAVIRPQ